LFYLSTPNGDIIYVNKETPPVEHCDNQKELQAELDKMPKIEGEHEDGYKSPMPSVMTYSEVAEAIAEKVRKAIGSLMEAKALAETLNEKSTLTKTITKALYESDRAFDMANRS